MLTRNRISTGDDRAGEKTDRAVHAAGDDLVRAQAEKQPDQPRGDDQSAENAEDQADKVLPEKPEENAEHQRRHEHRERSPFRLLRKLIAHCPRRLAQAHKRQRARNECVCEEHDEEPQDNHPCPLARVVFDDEKPGDEDADDRQDHRQVLINLPRVGKREAEVLPAEGLRLFFPFDPASQSRPWPRRAACAASPPARRLIGESARADNAERSTSGSSPSEGLAEPA